MAKTFARIDDKLAGWVAAQPVFFVATAPRDDDGHLNLSPKGLRGTFAVLDERTFAYVDLTGSGVETIAHLRENGRIVVMLCAFEGPPRIVRFHGRGTAVLPGDDGFDALLAAFESTRVDGLRAIIRVDVERIADSCGYGVPRLAYAGERDELPRWVARKGPDGIAAYQADKNARSIDGLPGLDAGRGPATEGQGER